MLGKEFSVFTTEKFHNRLNFSGSWSVVYDGIIKFAVDVACLNNVFRFYNTFRLIGPSVNGDKS